MAVVITLGKEEEKKRKETRKQGKAKDGEEGGLY